MAKNKRGGYVNKVGRPGIKGKTFRLKLANYFWDKFENRFQNRLQEERKQKNLKTNHLVNSSNVTYGTLWGTNTIRSGQFDKLNTAYSIVDFLKSIEVDSSFDNRAKLYKEFIGEDVYTGSEEQNVIMLQVISDKHWSSQNYSYNNYAGEDIENINSHLYEEDKTTYIKPEVTGRIELIPLNQMVEMYGNPITR